MMFRVLFLFLVALALACFLGQPAVADDKAEKGDTHEGTIVSVTATKLVMKRTGEETEHEHTLADNAKVSCDGKECKLEDLKPGQKIRVTTKKGDDKVATKIEALDKNKEFEKEKKDTDK
jgi:hypothetical protein